MIIDKNVFSLVGVDCSLAALRPAFIMFNPPLTFMANAADCGYVEFYINVDKLKKKLKT